MRTTALIALVALACLAVSSASAFADDPPEQAGKADSPVSSLLQQFILERESTEGQTGERPSSDAVTRSQADAGVTTKAVQGASGSAKSEAADDPVRFARPGTCRSTSTSRTRTTAPCSQGNRVLMTLATSQALCPVCRLFKMLTFHHTRLR